MYINEYGVLQLVQNYIQYKQDTVYCSLKNLLDQPIFQTHYSWGSGTIFIAGPADLNVFAGSKSIKLMAPYPSPVFYYLERKKIQRLIQKFILLSKQNYVLPTLL